MIETKVHEALRSATALSAVPILQPIPHQTRDLAGEQKGSCIFQQLLLVPNFILAGLRKANT